MHTVILIARYNRYNKYGAWPAFQKGFEKLVDVLVSSGKKVIVVYPVPEYSRPVPEAIGMMVSWGYSPDSYRLARSQYREDNKNVIAEMNKVTAKFHLRSIATEDLFCGPQYCRTYDGHNVLYSDDGHMSLSGARKMAAAIKPLL
jgi:lysophospholipase L1-like esterase